MRSFQHKPDPRHAMFAKLAGSVESQLREAYAKRHDQGRVNQARLAKLLGVGRSVIHRRLNGSQNLTLKSVADLVWGTGYAIEVVIYDPEDRPDKNWKPVQDAPAVVKLGTQTATVKAYGDWDAAKVHSGPVHLEVQS